MQSTSVTTAPRLPASETLVDAAVRLAEELLAQAAATSSRAERRRAARLGRLVEDPAAKRFAFLLTDRVSRPDDPAVAAGQLHQLVRRFGVPSALGPLDRAGLRAAAALGRRMPRLVMPVVAARVRADSAPMVLNAHPQALARHLRKRRAQRLTGNVNLLGEAILGDAEADRRLDALLARLGQPEVRYLSVKLSAIEANLSVLAFDDTVAKVAAKLRRLYRAAAAHRPPTFVNLDMEEYRDLWLTVATFCAVLDEAELRSLEAGIVLQAYLPDASAALDRLASWAAQRVAAGGAPIKIRLVKGANLAAERVEAELHGWPQAPYETKAEVDAHFKALVEAALDPSHAATLRVGVASHNVFDLAWAMLLAEQLGQSSRLDLEMLEGMAPAQSRLLADRDRRVVLYTPVATRRDFRSAVAYLARRLDENTAPDNFLAALHRLAADPKALAEQRDRFRAALADRRAVDTRPRRRQDRNAPPEPLAAGRCFANEADTDFSLAANRSWLVGELAGYRPAQLPERLTSRQQIDAAVARGRHAAVHWRALQGTQRAEVLDRVAVELAKVRGRAIAAMAEETGKVVAEGDPEVSEAVDFARYYADAARALDTSPAGARFEPFGLVLVAPPWNFPFAIPAGGVLAALAAGNAVILKPAPQAEQVGLVLAEALTAAGVPADLVQYLRVAEDEAGRWLVGHPGVDAVVLTGSWETARLFSAWRDGRPVLAETSGKNALVVAASADVDAAVRDLVRSAFGNAGQKCSAASLAIVDRRIYDEPSFLRQLADAVASLPVGPPSRLDAFVGPLVAPPDPAGPLHRALHRLDPGESWLVAPECRSADGRLWRPGVRLGVAPGSWFHHTECFGPVLGVMRADGIEQATDWQNAVAYGLTGGLHSLDDDEIAWWIDHVEVGNAYVNRPTTGAVVGRQPFGGWKRSVVGPGAKAGGPNYVAALGRWSDPQAGGAVGAPGERLAAARASYEQAWREHFAVDHDPAALRAERNRFRYRRLPGPVLVRWDGLSSPVDVARALEAARVTGTAVELSAARAPDTAWDVPAAGRLWTIEDDATLATRMEAGRWSRLRAVGALSSALREAAAAAELTVFDQPVVSDGRVELTRWLREQAVSETRHRYGNLLD